jgi:putative hydrolase of the HAD superfamily
MGSTLIEFENHGWDVLGKMGTISGYEFLKSRKIDLPEYDAFEAMLNKRFQQKLSSVKENLKEIKFEQVVDSLFEELGIDTTNGDFNGFLYEYYRPITEQATIIEGAVEVLKSFRQMKTKIGLISNTVFPADYHREELKRFGLYSFLNVSLFSCEFGYRKPYPEIYQFCLKQLGVKAEESVFVGDRLVEDVDGPQQIGMKGILKYRACRDYSAPIRPDAKVDSLNQLPQAVKELKWN